MSLWSIVSAYRNLGSSGNKNWLSKSVDVVSKAVVPPGINCSFTSGLVHARYGKPNPHEIKIFQSHIL